MAKKELMTKEENALANLGFEADVGGGLEGADKESYAIPFLRVIQKMSPEVDEADAKFIEGAKPGQFMNTVTSELMDGKAGVIFLPCSFQRRFIRWGPRGSETDGFKGEYTPTEVADLRKAGQIGEIEGRLYFATKDGEFSEKKSDRLEDTRSHFGLVVNEETGDIQQVLLSLSSTQIKKSKQLLSMLNSVKVRGAKGLVTPPTWVNRVRIQTIPESNEHGSWHGVKFTTEGFIQDKDLYDQGKAFHEAIGAGEARAAFEEEAPKEGAAEQF